MSNIFKNIQRSFEKKYVKFMGLKHIPGSTKELIYLDIKNYKGKNIVLDKTTIQKGDIVAELHIDNLNVHKIDNSLRTIIKNYQEEMNTLVKACDNINEYRNIKAVYGTTVLHPLLKYIGFTCFPVKNPVFRFFLRFWENMLKNSFSTEKNNNKSNNDPMTCWVSINKLRQKSQRRAKGE